MDIYKLSTQEFSAVSRLSAPERYQHFIKRVADWAVVWGLRDANGWAAVGDENNRSVFPVWPHPDYVSVCATGEWGTYAASPIDIHIFLQEWLPNMSKQGVSLSVFPVPEIKGSIISPLILQADIQEELSKIE